MAGYCFESLSDYDFECLVRDLLQAELGIRLESFSQGRDGGIDLRYSGSKGKGLVVQCKHYLKTGYSGLKSAVRREVEKVAELAPRRYLLVTSVSLTPHKKDELLTILNPYCHSPQDIYGLEDLENLLGMYPEVEKRNFKLWLTSTSVLERVVHSEIFRESAQEIEHIRRRLSRYVDTKSFPRAVQILDENRYCVISGIPGIGKSTLAEMLLIHYVDQGFEAVRVWEKIADARKVLDPTKKQIFYFDDFLGKTGLEHSLDRNEDERLLRFISDVRGSKWTRFILTTREYILNQARSRYEALRDSRFDMAKCTLSLGDYPQFARAKILYNHLFFSDLPQEYLCEFLKESSYRPIIAHKNYNPRVIEHMTNYLNVMDLTPHDYVQEFRANLDNPVRVWKLAFQAHLSQEARDLLLVMGSLRQWVLLEDLARLYEAFRCYRADKYNYTRGPYDFDQALKELEGNFTLSRAAGRQIAVDFHNPSVQDYLEWHFREFRNDLTDLLMSAVVPDQPFRLGNLLEKWPADHELYAAILNALHRSILEPSIAIVLWEQMWWRKRVSPEAFFLFALRLWRRSGAQGLVSPMDRLLQWFLLRVGEGVEDSEALELIIDATIRRTVPRHWDTKALRTRLFKALLEKIDSEPELADFQTLVSATTHDPDLLADDDQVSHVQDQFGAFAERECDSIIRDVRDPDEMLRQLSDLALVADELAVDIDSKADSVRSKAESIPVYEPEDEYDGDRGRTAGSSETGEVSEILRMFQTIGRRRD